MPGHISLIKTPPPPSQIAPSPLMLHNLSSQPVFDEMSQQQFIRSPPLENIWLLTGTNVTPQGGFQTNSQTKLNFTFQKWSQSLLKMTSILIQICIVTICVNCNFNCPWPQINQDPLLINYCHFAPYVSFCLSLNLNLMTLFFFQCLELVGRVHLFITLHSKDIYSYITARIVYINILSGK